MHFAGTKRVGHLQSRVFGNAQHDVNKRRFVVCYLFDFKMALRLLKFTCAAVSLSWLGSQSLLIYHLKYGDQKDPVKQVSPEAIPLSVKESRKGLIDAVLGLYALKYSKEHVASKAAYYDESAVFEDPGLYLKGRRSVASAYSMMVVCFSKSENLKMDIVHGKNIVVIDQLQKYTMFGSISFELPSVLYLYLNGEPGEEKIVHHVEEWYSKPLIGKEVPYFANIGLIAAQFRKLHGLPFQYIFKAHE